MSAQALQEFFVALGFEVDTKGLDKFEQQTSQVRDTVLSAGKVIGLAALAVGAFVTKIGRSIDDLNDFAEAEQIGVEALQEFGYAAKLSGSDMGAVKSSISAVNKVVGEAVLGVGRGAMIFQKLGMSAKNADGTVKSFDEILAEVSDRMQGMSRQEAIALAEKLGINRTLIPMLLKGRDHIAALREEARAFGIVTEADAEKAGLFADSMDRTLHMLGGLADQIGLNLMPAMTDMLDSFRAWAKENKEVIKSRVTQFIQVFNTVLGTMWDWLVRIANGLSNVVSWLTTTTGGIITLVAALSLVAKFAAYRAFGLIAEGVAKFAGALTIANTAALVTSAVIGGLILAIGLLIDDYVNWKEGNDSVIGDMIEKFPWILDLIQGIESAVGAFVGFWLEQWEELKGPVGDLGAALWSLLTTVVPPLWEVVKLVFTGWAHLIALVLPPLVSLAAVIDTVIVSALKTAIGVASGFVDLITRAIQGVLDIGTGIANVVGKVGNLLGFGNGSIQIAAESGGKTDAPTANNSVNSTGGVIGMAGSNTNTTSTVTQTTQITGTTIQINSPDPGKAGEAVRQELERMNKQATRNGQSAVAL